MRGRLLLLACSAALASGAAAPAQGATVSMPFQSHAGGSRVGPQDYYRFVLVPNPGETNRITVDGSDPRAGIRVVDAGAPLDAGENCRPDGAAVLCKVESEVPTFVPGGLDVDLGDGDDELTVTAMSGSVRGGPGSDRIAFPNNSLSVDGGPGADFIRANSGSVTYAGRTAGVSVTPDGVANDGEPGEGDDVGPTFARITGGEGGDQLSATDSGATLDGRAGDDRLFGGAGRDELRGGGGDDSLLGAGGDDQLWGGPDGDVVRGGDGHDGVTFESFTGVAPIDVTLDDRPGDGPAGENDDVGSDIESVTGTPGDDRIVGSDGPNRILGGGGNDHVDGAGGADTVSGSGGRFIGGPGPDSFHVRGGNGMVEARDGERDEVFCGGLGITYSLDPFDALPFCTPSLLRPRASTVRVRRDGTVRLALRCAFGPDDLPCSGKVHLYRRGHVSSGSPYGRRRFVLSANDQEFRRVDVRLTRTARRRLASKRRLDMSLVWSTRNPAVRTYATGRYDLKLLAPR